MCPVLYFWVATAWEDSQGTLLTWSSGLQRLLYLPSTGHRSLMQGPTWMTKVLPWMPPWPEALSSSRVAKTVPLPVAASRPNDPCSCTGCSKHTSVVYQDIWMQATSQQKAASSGRTQPDTMITYLASDNACTGESGGRQGMI